MVLGYIVRRILYRGYGAVEVEEMPAIRAQPALARFRVEGIRG